MQALQAHFLVQLTSDIIVVSDYTGTMLYTRQAA